MGTRLGQNFLKNPDIIEKIISASRLTGKETVLEIGPGRGALTRTLIKKAKKVIAVEIDEKLTASLKKRFKENKNLTIIQKDILKINLPELIENKILDKQYYLIANIPYYITSQIIRSFLETPYYPQKIILMTQKEVAERIVAKPGKMSLLSISVQYYATPKILFYVPRNSFFPVPQVESAVLEIIPGKIKRNDIKDKNFFQIVKAGFCAKRKTLLNNLSNSLHIEKEIIANILTKTSLPLNVRPQQLSLDNWKKLAQLVNNLNLNKWKKKKCF